MSEAFSARTRVRRQPERGVYDKTIVRAILDEALFCHVGLIEGAQPFVIPTVHARRRDTLYIHGSRISRLMAAAGGGTPLCVTVTLLDGLVLARSVFNHSMNYRSVVVLGRGRLVNDSREKRCALRALANHVMPGRWDDARQPTPGELNATAVVAVGLEECSAKVRSGLPEDDPADLALPVWAGVLPLSILPGEPIADPMMHAETVVPDYVTRWCRPRR